MHWNNFITKGFIPFGLGDVLGLTIGAFFFVLILGWSLIWKGFALWKAARLGHKPWFIVLLVVNTLGILEILYYYIFSKWVEDNRKKRNEHPTSTPVL
ncbi:MAG: hypothetical protein G01um101466_43 [Parcubacteria group bacterium Gr01-1014_66]|nr:MAG: hypothetical protein G01um101466_43 [Parcubacteria group bacterium Gr01-1014_66]